MVRCRAAVAATAVMLAGAWAVAAADAPPPVCAVAVGEPIVLRSTDFDPDVLVWDSRQRAIDYAGGNIHSATELLSHTLLSRPGTRAVVTACLTDTVQPKYTNDRLDTVGVKITSGPHRGRYGWVSSEDIRGSHASEASTRL